MFDEPATRRRSACTSSGRVTERRTVMRTSVVHVGDIVHTDTPCAVVAHRTSPAPRPGRSRLEPVTNYRLGTTHRGSKCCNSASLSRCGRTKPRCVDTEHAPGRVDRFRRGGASAAALPAHPPGTGRHTVHSARSQPSVNVPNRCRAACRVTPRAAPITVQETPRERSSWTVISCCAMTFAASRTVIARYASSSWSVVEVSDHALSDLIPTTYLVARSLVNPDVRKLSLIHI